MGFLIIQQGNTGYAWFRNKLPAGAVGAHDQVIEAATQAEALDLLDVSGKLSAYAQSAEQTGLDPRFLLRLQDLADDGNRVLAWQKDSRKKAIDQEVIARNANGYSVVGQLDLIAAGADIAFKVANGTATSEEVSMAHQLSSIYAASVAVKRAGETAKALVDDCQTVDEVDAVEVVWPNQQVGGSLP